MKFLLIALLTTNGQVHSYQLDSGLTADDCRAAIASPIPADVPTELASRLAAAVLTCEAE